MNVDKLLNELGQWWLPITSNHKVFGIIKKSDSNYLLELQGNLCQNASNNLNQIDKFDIIHGVVDNQKITLASSIVNSISSQCSFIYHFIFEHGFIGSHFDSIDAIKFKSINFSCGKALNDWLNLTYPKQQTNPDKFSLEYEFPETISIKLIKSQLIIKISDSYSYRATSNEINFKSTAFVSLEYLIEDNILPYSELLKHADWFTKFLHICCWQPIEKNDISFNINEPIHYFSGLIKHSAESISPFKIMPYQAIANNMDRILDNWYDNRDKYYVIGYIMAKLTDPEYNIPVELKFTQAIQATEVFHRRFLSLSNLENNREIIIKDYFDFFNALFQHENVDEEIKSLVHNKLSHLHEATLMDRINDLKTIVPTCILSETIIGNESYSEQISRFRNMFTHWGEKNNYPDLQDIHDYTESLRLLLVIAIFKKLELDDTIITNYIKPNMLFQRTLKTRPI